MRTKSNLVLETDRILPVAEAARVLGERFGYGWGVITIKSKIAEGRPFTWIEKKHYFLDGRRLLVNVDGVARSLLGSD